MYVCCISVIAHQEGLSPVRECVHPGLGNDLPGLGNDLPRGSDTRPSGRLSYTLGHLPSQKMLAPESFTCNVLSYPAQLPSHSGHWQRRLPVSNLFNNSVSTSSPQGILCLSGLGAPTPRPANPNHKPSVPRSPPPLSNKLRTFLLHQGTFML